MKIWHHLRDVNLIGLALNYEDGEGLQCLIFVFFKRSTNFESVIVSLNLVHYLTSPTVPFIKSRAETIACCSEVRRVLHVYSMMP